MWTNVARKVKRSDPEWQRLPPAVCQEYDEKRWDHIWWADWTFWVYLPGRTQDPERRHQWSTPDEKADTNGLDILNELGADGWEVISSKIDASAMGTNHGRENAAFPIQTTILLKRQVAR